MNRGSALKWIEEINNTKFTFASGQLRFDANGVQYSDVFGILCNFIDPDGWCKCWDEVSYSFHGEIFFMPTLVMKKCKIKTKECCFITDNGTKTSLVEINDIYAGNWIGISNFIEKYYEQF